MRAAVLLFCLVSTGCIFAPTAPIVALPPQPESLETRPGGVGVLDSVRYVIHISVDGLRPDAVERQTADQLPAFARLRRESAFTHNARTDADLRKTLPNHTSQLTGRGVLGDDGHEWTVNVDPPPGVTVHSNKEEYIASVFGVAHDAGLRTGAWVSKSKFSLFDLSYGPLHGAEDARGEDDGRDKIDTYLFERDTGDLTDALVADFENRPYGYAFLHLRDPDASGHTFSWSVRRGSRYMRAIRRADAQIAKIFDLVESDPRLVGKTALIVTADHGGRGRRHFSERPLNYTIPFYVWGPGIPSADLYALNADGRADPGMANPGYDAALQPVRNGDAANLALALLGLQPVPGSTIGRENPLRIAAEEGEAVAPGE